MRINRYVADALNISRRKADDLIAQGIIKIDGKTAMLGDHVDSNSVVSYDGKIIGNEPVERKVVLLNKPVGFVCSKDGQGAPTVFDLLPKEYRNFIIAGRLDKDSSGLVLVTNDGKFAQELSHPSNSHQKTYEVTLNKSLTPKDAKQIAKDGVDIGDSRPSKFAIKPLDDTSKKWQVILEEGRNRQIRRTFSALGYRVVGLNRISLADYKLGNIESGSWAKH